MIKQKEDKVQVIGYGRKKKKIVHVKCELAKMERFTDFIDKCELFSVIADRENVEDVLKFFWKYSCEKECYAPIAFSKKGEVLYFPKLRFYDSYLLKYILGEKIDNEKYNILYANKMELVTFS